MTRKPVHIQEVSAGSNADRVASSFDDDETTNWSSDGRIVTAWIKYDFEHSAKVSELTLKLGAWRTRSYPIRISIDEKVVFSGNTPQTLGYVTLLLPPTTGKSLKIELTGSPSDVDSVGNIVEITGKKDDPGTLRTRR